MPDADASLASTLGALTAAFLVVTLVAGTLIGFNWTQAVLLGGFAGVVAVASAWLTARRLSGSVRVLTARTRVSRLRGRTEDFIPVRRRHRIMRFNRDRRGQSVVVGTVVLFGFLILALSLYQVQIVPQENAEVEFQHFEEVRNDLVELRNGILSAGSSERPQFVDVKLGTRYQTRVFTVNPPDPVGTLRTSDAYNRRFRDQSEHFDAVH
ncbi:hypothetical protein EXE44_16265 [Halorubrum sp. SS7]|nr:hypothetical protein [Halorubrum sp. SS7]TKX55387.1 hypothetical protein EXE44_16265 [Halorubrum sp. SS7]